MRGRALEVLSQICGDVGPVLCQAQHGRTMDLHETMGMLLFVLDVSRFPLGGRQGWVRVRWSILSDSVEGGYERAIVAKLVQPGVGAVVAH